MREPFVHESLLVMAADADIRAPGGAVTVELCGNWEHEPPCPLAPHHTVAERHGDEVRVRILFAAEATMENEVRQGIERALGRGRLLGPDGVTTQWRLTSSASSQVAPEEADHAVRLTHS